MVLMLRELHNYRRVRGENNYFQEALQDTYDLLKPGGIVSVVQHRAPKDAIGPAGRNYPTVCFRLSGVYRPG